MGNSAPTRKTLPRPAADHPLWLIVMLGLIAGQTWLALGLFGAAYNLGPILDEQPILSGRHPLHLYHGYLGARSLLAHGCLSCYDPAFFAGYPKTPVFDAGSRPAEMVLALTGGTYRPAVYKLGLLCLCAAAPWLIMFGARGAGLSRAAACLAGSFAILIWWGKPCHEALEAGDVDLLLGGALAVAHAGQLIRYHREPGLWSLCGASVTGFLTWLAHPLIPTLLLVPFLIYYLSVGTRHPLAWHIALLGSLLAAIAANAFWLIDWFEYWWIRVPLRAEGPLLTHRTFHTIWDAPLWGTSVDRAFACFLTIAALIGLTLANQCGQRAKARLFGLAGFGFLALAIGGIASEPIGLFGTAQLFVPALLLLAVPAAFGVAAILSFVYRWTGIGGAGLTLAGIVIAFNLLMPEQGQAWWDCFHRPLPMQIGLDTDQEAICQILKKQTTAEARILWEDRVGTRQGSRWTALLPLLTERVFVGGLDPEAGIEHAAAALTDQTLAGRPLDAWTESELDIYFERYNIGWVVCWSESARRRFLPRSEMVADLRDGGPGTLLRVRRQTTFTLSGSARWLSADHGRIVLADVTPRNGEVVLSLHYQAGLTAAPARVLVDAKIDPLDPIPFVRLKLDKPAARVTLTWEKP